jgi:hypothetical protein
MEDLKFKTAGDVANTVDPDFTCAKNSNFQLNVNGFRISIAFGPGMYVENDTRYSKKDPRDQYVWGSKFAEVKIWDRNNEPILWDDLNAVIGWCSSDCVARMIGCLASCPPDHDPRKALIQIEEASR